MIPLIIPAYEPDVRMNELIAALRQAYDGEIIIVNDGSGYAYNGFYEYAESQGCVVLKHYKNMGKGRSLKDAFNYCLNTYPDLLGCVTADSDGQHKVEDILRCMEELERNNKELILGCRSFSGSDVPNKSRFGNRLTVKVCKFLCGLDISDSQTGLRGIPKTFMIDLLNVSGERFEFETRMLIASKDFYPIREISIQTVYDSRENHQTHFKPFRDSIQIYKIFAGMFFKFTFSSLSSSVLDIWLFYLFCMILKGYTSWYLAFATMGARIISAVYNYMINYKFVFRSKEKHEKSAGKYVILAVLQLICSVYLLVAVCELLPFLPEMLIKVAVDVVLFFISYVIQRKIVFQR